MKRSYLYPFMLALAGCAPGASLDTTSDEVIAADNPYTTRQDEPLAPLEYYSLSGATAVSGYATFQPLQGTTPASVLGQYRNGTMFTAGFTESSYASALASASGAPSYVSPALSTHLSAAFGDGERFLNDPATQASTSELASTIHSVLGVTATTPTGGNHVGVFPIEDARWQSGSADALTTTSYTAPQLAEMRMRGAKLYCAARALYARQGASPGFQGSVDVTSVTLFGRTIRLLVMEPRVVMGAPRRETANAGATPDGAQAFAIPFELGARFTPIEGIGLPALAEMRHPVVYTAGESEVSTAADRRSFRVGTYSTSVYTRTYRTLVHEDAVSWQDRSLGWRKDYVIARIGPFITLRTGLNATLTAGQLNRPGDVGAAPDARVLDTTTPADMWTAYPTGVRDGSLFTLGATGYHDGFWRYAPSYRNELGVTFPATWGIMRGSTRDLGVLVSATSPVETRVREDNDRVVEFSTKASLTGSLTAALGVSSAGPFTFDIEGATGVTASIAQNQVLRESAQVEVVGGSTVPVTALTIRPRTVRDVTIDPFSVVFKISFEVDLGWLGSYTVTWEKTLLDFDPIHVATSTTLWNEDSALRIGEGSTARDPLLRPGAHSHLPNEGADHDAFSMPGASGAPERSWDVLSCLADGTEPAGTPPACRQGPVIGSTPAANFCVSTNVQFPLCSTVIPSTATDPTSVCYLAMQSALCGSGSYQYGAAVSRIVDPSNLTTANAIQAMAQACARAWLPADTTAATAQTRAQDLINSRFTFGACDATAHIYAPADGMTVGGGSAPSVAARPCS